MKLGSSLLLLALTAGLAALAAVKNTRPGSAAAEVSLQDADAWFV
ncbi:MAG: hypothetical protein Q8W46_04215 [Candidatus Palauibacterales bacterium]|jgi:hypothetical protein|nr:hypothetical protein [Candidatus Palauibacterales bacterium]